MKILIADDSRAMRLMIKKTMREAGHGSHTFIEAADGIEALEMIEKEKPGFVLCDWNMPNMSGMELLLTLRNRNDTTAFGFITTECSNDARRDAEAAGARFVITKPFTATSFAHAMDPVL
ncbi:MAG: response regulator [Gammaproteobacteria bacterium]|nr:response regulator [Gammaproteobacteria bacterium]